MTTETVNKQVTQVASGNALAHHVREVLMLMAIIGLIACNVATVVSSTFADVVHGAVSAVASVAGAKLAERVLSSSPKVRQVKAVEAATKDMHVKAAVQDGRLKDLEVQHKSLQARHMDLDKQHKANVASKLSHIKAMKLVATSIRGRLVRGTVRHTTALTSEAIPAVGLAVNIGMAAYDVYDACETLKELNGVLKAADQPLEDMTTVCGFKLPTYNEVVASVATNWRDAIAKSKSELGDLNGKVTIPEVRIPTAGEVMRVTCPVVSIPRLCAN